MADSAKPGSGVPLVPLRRVDDLADKIERLIGEAHEQGYGTLAYFLGIALSEARIQLGREREDRDIADADPSDLWLLEKPIRGDRQ
jgi:hypothetical protein